jgi:nucleoside-diphosphate-sugar epimerase
MIYGPPIHSPPSLSGLNESNSQLWKIISAGKNSPVPDAFIPLFVDVRDIAMAHVLAMDNPKAANQRYTVAGGQYSNQEVSHTFLINLNLRLSTLSVQNSPIGTLFPSVTLARIGEVIIASPTRSKRNWD